MVAVETARGKAVLCGDIAYTYRNLRERIPVGWYFNLPDSVVALDRALETASSPELSFPNHDPEIMQGHRNQRAGLAFAAGDEHVHLPARLRSGHVIGQTQKLVGLLAHRRGDEHDLVASPVAARHVVGDLADSIRVTHRGAAELLNKECHGQ